TVREDLPQPIQTLAIRSQAVIALIQLDAVAAAAKAAELLADAKPAVEFADVFQAFLTQKGGANALAKALVSKKLNADFARLGLKDVAPCFRRAQLPTHPVTSARRLPPQA